MPIEILMPALSPTMTEGNLSKWNVKEGDKVSPGDVIAEIETDKATMEVESIDEGVVGKILVAEGTQNVPINTLIAVLLEEGESADSIKDMESKSVAPAKGEAAVVVKEEKPTQLDMKTNVNTGEREFATPLAKRIAADKGIDLKSIQGSGPHGRIVKDDVLNFNFGATMSTKAQNFVGRHSEEFRKVPNTNIRKVIASRLIESKTTIPHFYLSIECNIDKLMKIRAEMNAATNPESPAYKLSVNDFIIKAIAMGLRDVPEANSSWTDEAILLYNNVDVSVAVAIDGGLITPIVRNADQKSLSVISNEMKDLAKRAREGKLAPEEFQGGGFSVSNLGMYGIKKFEAIVNPPQGAILSVGAGEKRPIVVGDEIKIANMVWFSLSCDHRVIDGAVGANFLRAFRSYIENPVLTFV
jgi:pyruvate dehydrogenase E2 component (dihydrolipoyllysine-residue acetyltransferase)